MAYAVPDAEAWPPQIRNLTMEEAKMLAVIDLKVEYETHRGGHVSVVSRKKNIALAVWRASPLAQLISMGANAGADDIDSPWSAGPYSTDGTHGSAGAPAPAADGAGA